MHCKATLASLVGAFAAAGFAAPAAARNWLEPLPANRDAITAGALALRDVPIRFGQRVRVRIFAPEGVYELDDADFNVQRAFEIERDEAPADH